MSRGKRRQATAFVVLFSILALLLLSLNFRIWSGTYTEGDTESIVTQCMARLENGKTEKNTEEEHAESDRDLAEYAYTADAITNNWLLVLVLFGIYSGYIFLRPSITLCSLSVRMDD